MGTARQDGGAAPMNGGALFVGGESLLELNGATTPSTYFAPGSEIFDPIAQTFAAGPSPTSDRINGSLDVVAGGDALLAGGEDANGPVLAVERFSSINLTWATALQLPGARERHGSMASGADLLLAGGIDTTNGALTTLATADLINTAANTVTSYTGWPTAAMAARSRRSPAARIS